MHRIYRVPHSLVLIALLGLAGIVGPDLSRAVAQERVTAVNVPVNGSQIVEMSKKQRIKDIDNKDQNVARVEFVPGSDFRRVMINGGAVAGLSRLVLTDNEGNRETFDIVVEFNIEFLKRVLAQAAPTANIQIVQGTGGTLVLTGTVSHAADIDIIMRTAVGAIGDPARVINAMRIGGVQQVQLDVIIARVSRSTTRKMGFSFLSNGTQGFLTSTVGGAGNLAGTTIANPASVLTGTPNIAFGIFQDSRAFLGFLEALRTEDLAKIMAQPKVCTLSGRPAEFISGGEQAVPTLASGSAGGGAVAGVDFVPFGTTVRFLPVVLGDGKIYLEVEPQFTFPDPNPLFSAPVNGGTTFGRTTQRVQTSAILEDGQTLAIGGMVFHQVNGNTRKIPVLGDLPFIGTAFSRVEYSNSEEDLLILITPHLVDAMSCRDLPKFLPGEETRKPDDFELFLERILEAPRGPREVWQCDKYMPAYKNGPTAGMFPCPDCDGPRGACDLGLSFGPGCGPGGISTGVLGNSSTTQPTATVIRPMAPAPPAPMPPRPQHLPEIRGQFQSPVDRPPMAAIPVEALMAAPAPTTRMSGSSVPAAGTQPMERPANSSGVTLARPTPLDSR